MNLPAPLFGLLVGLLIVGAVALTRPRSSSRSEDSDDDREPDGRIHRDDPRYWLAGFIYNNPADPSLFVPKRYGNGFTVNFGRPIGKVFLIGTVLVVIAFVVLKHH